MTRQNSRRPPGGGLHSLNTLLYFLIWYYCYHYNTAPTQCLFITKASVLQSHLLSSSCSIVMCLCKRNTSARINLLNVYMRTFKPWSQVRRDYTIRGGTSALGFIRFPCYCFVLGSDGSQSAFVPLRTTSYDYGSCLILVNCGYPVKWLCVTIIIICLL